LKVVIANFSAPLRKTLDFRAAWARHVVPPPQPRLSLLEQPFGWGFHVLGIGVHMLDRGMASEAEFWDFAEERTSTRLSNGMLRVTFFNPDDVRCYLERYGYPDLFVNYGPEGLPILEMLEGRAFRVHVPCLRPQEDQRNHGAECYLVDEEEFLDERSMLYVPMVNTRAIHPVPRDKRRDFVYLASVYWGKRHDLLLDAVRGTSLTGHLHPVADPSQLDLRDTNVTTTAWDEVDVLELLTSSRIAVYPGDGTSNPAAMWECVAAGLPIVVNREIAGGRYVVVPGVTGELAAPDRFREVMERVLTNRASYRPREHLQREWDPIALIEDYLAFFARMGWSRPSCS